MMLALPHCPQKGHRICNYEYSSHPPSALDFINVMAYDMHGAWEHGAGHNAPLYKSPADSGATAFYNIVSFIYF